MAPTTPLTQFPRPTLAADLVLLTLIPGEPLTSGDGVRLGVVTIRRDDGVAVLPGRLLRERQTVDGAVRDVVEGKLGLPAALSPNVDLLGVHDAPDRDPRGWVIALAYVGSLPVGALDQATGESLVVLPVGDGIGSATGLLPELLGYDHDAMVAAAIADVRRRYEELPDPLGLLEPPYSLSELRRAHEAVLDEPLKRDTFNRRMREHLAPALDDAGQELFTSASVGRPAQLFTPTRPEEMSAEHFPLPRDR